MSRAIAAAVLTAGCLLGALTASDPAQATTTLTLVAAPAAAGTACSATTPCSLQQALTDAATDNRGAPVKITLTGGLYSGAFIWSDSSGTAPSTLTVSGPGTLEGATIDADGAGPALTVAAPVGTVELVDLTLTGGSAAFGAGIDETAGTLRVVSSTIAGDHATVAGGAIDVAAGSALLEGSTIAGDTATTEGAFAASSGASLTLHADVIAGNGPMPSCDAGAITDDGYDVADDASCLGTQPAPTSSATALDAGLFGGAPALAPGAQEGAVVPLLGDRGDPAFDDVPASVGALASSGSFCSAHDERGAARLQLGAVACDSGSMQYSRAVLDAVEPTTGEPGTSVTVTGGGFLVETSVTLGSATVVPTVLSDRSLTFSVPVTAAGPSSIIVATPDGSSTLSGAFDVVSGLAVSTASLPQAEVGAPYDASLQASGGTPPYSWSSDASLPSGLSLSASGVLSGTPQVTGTVDLALEVDDASDVTAGADVSLVVQPPPAVATSSLPTGEIGQPYSVSLAADGGIPPYSWSIAAGGVPAGLLLSSDGTLSGIPGAAGTTTIDLRVSDGARSSSTASLSFTVLAGPLPAERYGVLSGAGMLWLSTGATERVRLRRHDRVAAIAPAPRGWWVVTRAGRVLGVGGARSLGSLPDGGDASQVTAIAAVRGGYLVLRSSGAVYAFGAARAEGSLELRPGGARAVGIAASGRDGYWVLESDGAVTAFGSAPRFGSPPLHDRLGRFVGIAADPSSPGYWVVNGSGTVLAFGSAEGEGSVPASADAGRIIAIAAAPDGAGYWVASSDGELFAIGSARLTGSSQQSALGASGGGGTGSNVVGAGGASASAAPAAAVTGATGAVGLAAAR